MGFVAPPSGCNDVVGAAPPPGGSNVVSVSYNTGTQQLTVATDQPATYTTTIPLSLVTDNGDGTFTFDNQVDPPVTWNGSGLVQTVTGYWVDNSDPVNPIITTPKTNITTTSPTINDDAAAGYSAQSWWFNSTRQALWICTDPTNGAAVWSPVDNIHIAAVAPVVGNDNTQGYFIGSSWFDTVAGTYYICVSAATGAAVWTPINPATVVSITATDPIVATPATITGIGVISANIQTDATMTGNGTVATPLHVVGSALDFAIRVRAATTAVLPNTPVYNNGVGGIGATLTRTGNGALPAQDGVTLIAGDLLLVKNQATQLENGVYTVTSAGGAGAPWVLTRPTSSDQTAELDNQVVVVAEGTTQGSQIFAQQTQNPIIGASAIVYTLQTGVYVTQQTTGTQVNRQLPWWTGTARQLSRGIAAFTFDASNRLVVGTARINSADGDIELIKNITYDWPAAQSVGVKLLTNDGAGNLTWSTSVYTNEDAQDAVGTILTDTNTIDFTYNDVANTIIADVRTQMSITSDVNGIEFLNDLLAPGNTKYYGTSGAGVKGWLDYNEAAQDAVGNILTDTATVNMTYNDAGNTITADVITQLSVTSDASGVKLVNDVLAPGNLEYYGTDGTGVKGFFALPAGGLVNITYAALAALIAGGTVVEGQFYNITNATASTASPFTNIIGLIVQGTSINSVSLQGSAGFWNADYQNVGNYTGIPGYSGFNRLQWNATEAGYQINDIVIYNAQHFKIQNAGALNGTVPTVNTTAYAAAATFQVDHGYIQQWDYVEYDFTNDWLQARIDRRGNEIREDFAYETNYGFGINYIKLFQWGNNLVFNNKASDAGLFCLNNSGQIFGNQLQTIGQLNASSNSGVIADNTFYSESFMTATSNAGQINANHLTNVSSVDLNNQTIAGTFNYNIVESQSTVTCTNNSSTIDTNIFSSSTVDLVNNAAPVFKNIIETLSVFTATNNTGGIFYNTVNNSTVTVLDVGLTGILQNNIIYATTLDLTAYQGTFAFNKFINNSTTIDFSACVADIQLSEFLNGVTFTATNNTAPILRCVFNGCQVEMTNQTSNASWNSTTVNQGCHIEADSNDGLYVNSIFEQGCHIVGNFSSTFGFDGCRISCPYNLQTAPFDPSTLYVGNTMESRNNNFPATVDITGLTNIDLTGFDYAGVINLTSGNATETLDTMTNVPTTWPIKITPVNGLTVTINSQPAATAGASDFILENNTAVTMTVNQGFINDYLIVENVGFITQTGGRIL